jgi:hypothetical protein
MFMGKKYALCISNYQHLLRYINGFMMLKKMYMKLFNNNFTFYLIKNEFDFLVKDFGYKLLSAKKVEKFRADYFFVYRNNHSEKQIEICADESWFHSEIRRLINNIPADYHDEKNCISFEDLAIWESKNHYNHFDYFVGGSNLKTVLNNVSNLFKRNKNFLTSKDWIDTNFIQFLKDEEFKSKFGFLPERDTPTFFSCIKKASTEYLKNWGFKLTFDSDLMSPFYDNLCDKLIFEKPGIKIEISQRDWRDDYLTYEIIKNDKQIFEIDVSNYSIEEAVGIVMSKLKENL